MGIGQDTMKVCLCKKLLKTGIFVKTCGFISMCRESSCRLVQTSASVGQQKQTNYKPSAIEYTWSHTDQFVFGLPGAGFAFST